MIIPFLVAVASVAVFSLFAWLASRYRQRLLMWVGVFFFLAGCGLFGGTVIRLPFGWMIAAIAFFTVLFGLAAGYFVRRGRAGN